MAVAVADLLDLTAALHESSGKYIPDPALAVAEAFLGVEHE